MRVSLIDYARPFLELGICKEYCMARKTTGNTTTKSSKKTEVPVQPPTMEAAPEVRKDARKNGKTDNVVPFTGPVNLEEEIRRRAYELYLERRATAGGDNGDENQDWLIAESEIRSRYGRLARHTTA
jgi:hypothetical protein